MLNVFTNRYEVKILKVHYKYAYSIYVWPPFTVISDSETAYRTFFWVQRKFPTTLKRNTLERHAKILYKKRKFNCFSKNVEDILKSKKVLKYQRFYNLIAPKSVV